MTKSEQFAQAIKAALAAAEPHRALYWRFCREYTAKSLAKRRRFTRRVEATTKKASGKTPAEIISDAEAAAAAWQMLKKQRDDYQNNIRGLRHMLQAISFDNWADSWRVTAF